MDYSDPDVWETLDPARQQVHLLQRIAEDTKAMRSILNFYFALTIMWLATVMGPPFRH